MRLSKSQYNQKIKKLLIHLEVYQQYHKIQIRTILLQQILLNVFLVIWYD